MAAAERDLQIGAIAALSDPVRRALYEHVAGAGQDVSRDQAAAAVGINRSLAASHLDRLVREGLLEATYRRLGDRTGPGAGRPSKLYRRAAAEFGVSLPPRRYELAATVLLDAAVKRTSDDSLADVRRAARALGHTLGSQNRDTPSVSRTNAPHQRLLTVLEEEGFEPSIDGDGTVRLRNCPFRALSRSQPETVCGMNQALVSGILEGLGHVDADSVLDPDPTGCCVAVVPRRRRVPSRRPMKS